MIINQSILICFQFSLPNFYFKRQRSTECEPIIMSIGTLIYSSTFITCIHLILPCRSSFECHNGCEIDDSNVNDGWCGCSSCEDEDDWTCDTCDCPMSCGDYHYCQGENMTFNNDSYTLNSTFPFQIDQKFEISNYCTNAWQRYIIFAGESLIIMICFFAVSYFSYQMFGCRFNLCTRVGRCLKYNENNSKQAGRHCFVNRSFSPRPDFG